MAGRLVIVRHYEPPEDPKEMANLRRRVFEILFGADAVERLTEPQPMRTMRVGEVDLEGGDLLQG